MLDRPNTYSTWRTSFGWSLLGHVILLVLMLWAPFTHLVPERGDQEVVLVRLRGGGDDIPGWMRPEPTQADNVQEPDGLPEPLPQAEPDPETHIAREDGVNETNPDAPGESGTDQQQQETGEGVGDRPGPSGPGFGIRSDASFAGADAYLSRIEAEVQRNFNYNGAATGAVTEYHFFIDRRGQIRDLVLNQSSGINSLDLAARRALIRSRFAPLPAGFRHNRLGVTYRFYDAD